MLSLEKGKAKAPRTSWPASGLAVDLREENDRLSGFAVTGDDKVKAMAGQIGALSADLEKQKEISNEAMAKVDLLNQQLLALRRQIAALNEALEASEKKDKDSQARIKDLGARLNAALARQVQELQRYRSDFFGRLRELLKDRKDIRVVGDRFVFQSEVLFPSGQAHDDAGRPRRHGSARRRNRRAGARDSQGDRLGAADRRPHRRPAHRQPAVPVQLGAVDGARHLGRQATWSPAASAAKRLVAAGYGEFQPIEDGNSEDALRKNRRIELKLTSQ